MTSTQQRFNAAVAAVKAAGVTVRVNVRAATPGSVEHKQLGVTRDTADATPYAWTYGGQGDAVRWVDGEAFKPNEYRRFIQHSRYVSPQTLMNARVRRVYWYHGGPGMTAAGAVAEAFKREGFGVEWDGSAGSSVLVWLPVPTTQETR